MAVYRWRDGNGYGTISSSSLKTETFPLAKPSPSYARLKVYSERVAEVGIERYYAPCQACVDAGGYTQTTGTFQAGYCPHTGSASHKAVDSYPRSP